MFLVRIKIIPPVLLKTSRNFMYPPHADFSSLNVCSHQTRRRYTIPYKVNVETWIGRNLSLEKPAARFDWRRNIFPCHGRASSRELAARQFRWSWNILTLPQDSRDDSQSAFTPWVKLYDKTLATAWPGEKCVIWCEHTKVIKSSQIGREKSPYLAMLPERGKK